MPIPDDARRRFELLGRNRIAEALARGRYPSLGLPQELQEPALEWVAEQDASQATSILFEKARDRSMRIWTIVAAIASVIAAVASVIGLFK
jgi:hypothetical protein